MTLPSQTATRKYDNTLFFKVSLFRKLQQDYFKNTPESDSLYRRRNKLILFGASISYFLYSHRNINQFKVLFKSGFNKELGFITVKVLYLMLLIASPQLVMKYILYLNKIYKSYQFGLEGVLKYNLIISKDFKYNIDFDIVDSTNIKKIQ